MSASVATHMAGLPNFDYSSDNMPDFTATEFPHHMELDRSTELDNNHDHHDHDSSKMQKQDTAHTGDHAANTQEETEALGNLLGALIPNQGEQSGDATNFNAVENGFPGVQEQFATNGQDDSGDQAIYDHSRLPSFDATAAANELFSTEDFSQLDPTMNIPYTPNGHNMLDMDMSQYRRDSYASQGTFPRRPATPQQREFEAFARLQFEDGSYYLNTYACELGRDVLAYRAALQKEREEKEAEINGHGKSRSSSGRASHPSGRMRRQLGSQMQGSVVSEQGGFAGIDEPPMRPPQNPEKPTMSSQESESSVVKPAEYLINPRTMPSFDYHRSTEMQAKWTAQEENEEDAPDDEQPAAVTAAHLPNPHMCPLIPIHGKPKENQTDAELHKKISRRHVKIYWSFERDCWEMKVQGRNGAFCDEKFVRWKGVVPLRDGAIIQIAHVVLTFRLPKSPQQQQQEAQHEEMDIDADEALPSVESRQSESVVGDERRESVSEMKLTPKISLKLTQKVEQTPTDLPLGPDGLPIVKRRGPGRPPKDGIMSTRERKEREKAAKMAAAREANGGRTPPASMRPKLSKPTPPAVEEIKTEVKPSKRKYTKRKSTDENGNPLFDMDGDDDEGEAASDGEPKSKKARAQREKSESPEYPPRESLTAEQLARPPESYAQLLYKILLELYPRALPLKDIYRELKMRHPWYVYEATTEGWQSSVRHNLNSEFGKLFDKGDKEGKGFAWRAIPNAQLPQTEKKRTIQAPAQRPRPPPQRPQFQPIPGQNIQWQGTGAFPANGGQQPFINHGPWPQQGQPNGTWQQNGTPPAGVQPQPPTNGVNGTAQLPPSQRPAPTNPQSGAMQTGANTQPMVANRGGGGSQPPSGPPQPVSLAASNMPCTLAGIEAIKRFQNEMYRQLAVDAMPLEKQEFWAGVFASSKKRVLHGHSGSTHPKGESREEATIMTHMKSFVERFANPNFKGFTPRPAQLDGLDKIPSQAQATPSTQVLTQSTPSTGSVPAVAPTVTPIATGNSETAAGNPQTPVLPVAAAPEIVSAVAPSSQSAQSVADTSVQDVSAVTPALPDLEGEPALDATQ